MKTLKVRANVAMISNSPRIYIYKSRYQKPFEEDSPSVHKLPEVGPNPAVTVDNRDTSSGWLASQKLVSLSENYHQSSLTFMKKSCPTASRR